MINFVFISGWAVAFKAISWAVEHAFLQSSTKKRWSFKVRNTAVSLLHSATTSLGAFLMFYLNPDACYDLINVWSNLGYHLTLLSIGYFLYDLLDILSNDRLISAAEMTLHHITVIVCFYSAIYTHKWIGYVMVAMIIEFNSCFLHVRQLMKLYCVDEQSPPYRMIAIANLITFVFFRLVVEAWMTRWLVKNRGELGLAFSLGSVGMLIIMITSLVLFYRILKKDFGFQVRQSSKC